MRQNKDGGALFPNMFRRNPIDTLNTVSTKSDLNIYKDRNRPSEEYCISGKLANGEKYNPNIHHHNDYLCEERCPNYKGCGDQAWGKTEEEIDEEAKARQLEAFKANNPEYRAGGFPKITFYINDRKRTQNVYLNKRGTKCVNIKGELVPISKLKKSPPK